MAMKDSQMKDSEGLLKVLAEYSQKNKEKLKSLKKQVIQDMFIKMK